MPSPAPRRFTLLDLAVVIALIACTAAWVKVVDPTFHHLSQAWDRNSPVQIFTPARFYAARLLIPFTLGGLVLRLARPRPAWARLWRQPGLVALAAANAAIALNVVLALLTPALYNAMWVERYGFWFLVWNDGVSKHASVSSAVLGAWTVLALSRRWRPEGTWVDRFGTTIAVLWIGLFAVEPIIWLLR